jgi:hypothetical protein
VIEHALRVLAALRDGGGGVAAANIVAAKQALVIRHVHLFFLHIDCQYIRTLRVLPVCFTRTTSQTRVCYVAVRRSRMAHITNVVTAMRHTMGIVSTRARTTDIAVVTKPKADVAVDVGRGTADDDADAAADVDDAGGESAAPRRASAVVATRARTVPTNPARRCGGA